MFINDLCEALKQNGVTFAIVGEQKMKGIQSFKEEMIVPNADEHVDELLAFLDSYQKLVACLQPKLEMRDRP